jgi:long-chain-fatty-acid--CoA ligase ACSBG
MFNETVNNKPDALALAFKSKDNLDWNKISYKQYWEICRKAAKSFIKLGLDVNQCVGIIGFNSPEWFFSLLGAIFAG